MVIFNLKKMSPKIERSISITPCVVSALYIFFTFFFLDMYLELHHPTSSMETSQENQNNSAKRYSFKNWFQTSMTLVYPQWVSLKVVISFTFNASFIVRLVQKFNLS